MVTESDRVCLQPHQIGTNMTQEVYCDAYSGGCVSPPPLLDYPFDPGPINAEVATPTVSGPAELPLTGFTYGDMMLVAVLLLALGALALVLAKRRKT